MERMDPIEFARSQRRSGNSWEREMWELLRNRQRCGKKFRRQHPLGPYIADFFCAEARLDVEIDGKHHFTEEGQIQDAARDAWMKENGIRVLRFTGKAIEEDFRAVVAAIDKALKEPRFES